MLLIKIRICRTIAETGFYDNSRLFSIIKKVEIRSFFVSSIDKITSLANSCASFIRNSRPSGGYVEDFASHGRTGIRISVEVNTNVQIATLIIVIINDRPKIFILRMASVIMERFHSYSSATKKFCNLLHNPSGFVHFVQLWWYRVSSRASDILTVST